MKQFSAYQTAIFDFVQNGEGNGVVSATAGSGKTTTLVEVAAQVIANPKFDGQDLFFGAFNKAIQEELASRLPGNFTCKTFHAHGMQTLSKATTKRMKVDSYKYNNLVRERLEKTYKITSDNKDFYSIYQAAGKLIEMTQVNLVDYSKNQNLVAIANQYDIEMKFEYTSMILDLVKSALTLGKAQILKDGIISFGDMVWGPSVLGLEPKQYDFMMIDEAQDLNRAQMMLIRKSLKATGRALFVGDRMQAIYGFAGADANSLDNIKVEFEAVEMPLSICYRCPSSHVALAKTIDPTIEAAPGASEGIIGNMDLANLAKVVKTGDMVLCRTTAPLVSACYTLIGQGISATVKGQDIGKGLIKLIGEVFKGVSSFSAVTYFGIVQAYKDAQTIKVTAKYSDSPDQASYILGNLFDKVEVLNVIYDSTSPVTVKEMVASIETLFSDKYSPVVLSTIHRAKGLETDTVYLLRPELLPHPMAKSESARQGEQALLFVAYTRSKNKFMFVHDQKGE